MGEFKGSRLAAKLLLLAVAHFQAGCFDSLLYYPTRISKERLTLHTQKTPWQKVEFSVAPEVTVRGLLKQSTQDPKSLLLYFGGNAMSLLDSKGVLDRLTQETPLGAAVVAYRGYDGSQGKPSEKALLADAEKIAFELFRQYGYTPNRCIIIGQSLGSGVAVHLAHRLEQRGLEIAGLVLISPFTSIKDVAGDLYSDFLADLLLRETYPTAATLPKVRTHTLLIHGEDDRIIAPKHSKRLQKRVNKAGKDRTKVHLIAKRGHNNLWQEPSQMALIIRQFARQKLIVEK